jgi:VanZ family protein
MNRAGRLRFSGAWTVLGLFLVGTVVFMSLAPLSPSTPLVFPGSDKVLHLAAYAAMMFWFGQIYLKISLSLFVAAGLILLGVLLEILQGGTGYRTFEYTDMAANALGVLLGLTLSRTRLGNLLWVCERVLGGKE